MKIEEVIEIINFLKANWSALRKIKQSYWKRIRSLFQQGEKVVGFVKRPEEMNTFVQLSRRSFLRKYSVYILPSEYRAYLIQSIYIRELYRLGNRKEADKKRCELNKQDWRAGRLFKLHSSTMLTVLWKTIDSMIAEGYSDDLITGKASKMLDDLMNDKALIYINQYRARKAIIDTAIGEFKTKGYCLIFGTDSQIPRVEKVRRDIAEHPAFARAKMDINYWNDEKVSHACLTITEQVYIEK